RSHPVDVPAAQLERARDREAREDMASGTRGHDEDRAAHNDPPRMRYLFSQSMRSRIASAMQVTTMPVPPKESSGNVRPLVGSSPMFTPMLMNAWPAIHTPMPCATSAA